MCIRQLALCPAVGLGDLQVFCLRFIAGFDCGVAVIWRLDRVCCCFGVIERSAAGFYIPGGVLHLQRLAGGRLRIQEHLKAAEVVHHRAENLLIDRGGIDLFCDLEQVLLGEVEGDAEVGGVQTALHVKHGQGVYRFFIARQRKCSVAVRCSVVIVCIQRTIKVPFFGFKVDRAAHGVMDAAHIEHELAVNEYPAVVVAGKLEGNFALISGCVCDDAALRHGKLQVHALAEHIVQSVAVYCISAIVAIVITSFMERHVGRIYFGAVFQIKSLCFIHEVAAVRILLERAALFLAVILPVAVFVQLEREIDVVVNIPQRYLQWIIAAQKCFAEIGGLVPVQGQFVAAAQMLIDKAAP